MALLQKAYLGSTPLFREDPWWVGTEGIIVDRVLFTDATASATPHTKGAWSEVIASTSGDVGFIEFTINGTGAVGLSTAQLIDIGIGASGSETVIVPDIAVGGIGNISNPVFVQIPLNIPAGSRIAIRNQAEIASDTCRFSYISLYGFNPALVPSTLDVLGTDTATSTGTELTGSSGTWTEIVASTSQAYTGFCLVPSTSEATQDNFSEVLLQVGVGAAGSESVLGGLYVTYSANEFVRNQSQFVIIGGNVPAGSRLSVRHNKSVNPNKMDVCLIAFPQV